jgi:esterase/lipase superfamily enzyme
MPDIAFIGFVTLVVAIALAVYLLAWRATGASSAALKVLVRAGLPVLIALPVVSVAILGWDVGREFGAAPPPTVGAPAGGGTPSIEAEPEAMSNLGRAYRKMEESRDKAMEEERLRRESEVGASKRAAEPPPPAAANGHGEPRAVEVGPSEEPAVPKPDAVAPPDSTRNGEPTPTPAGGAGAGAPETAPAVDDTPSARGLEAEEATEAPAGEGAASTAKAAAQEEEWDVVPVFYGTDRARAPGDKRIEYTPDRGRRLELGRALVTVPKAHEVPTIERPWAIRIPLLNVAIYEEAEDPRSHFTMKEIKVLPEADFLKLVRERLGASSRYKDHAFIFVHGYNTSFDYAIYRAAQIAYDLKFDGAPFAYSWPSGGGLASYTYDRESSGQSEPFLKEFVELVIQKSGAKSVSVIAHSMGNQPTLQVLKDLKAAKPEGVMLSQIILAAPDVDRDNFENIAREIKGLAKGVTLYAAANDRALQVSRSFYGGVPRAGDVPPTGPLVLSGVDTIDVTAASTDSLGLNHSGYAENNALLTDIAVLLLTGGKPDVRTPTLEQVATQKGPYWRFPEAR